MTWTRKKPLPKTDLTPINLALAEQKRQRRRERNLLVLGRNATRRNHAALD